MYIFFPVLFSLRRLEPSKSATPASPGISSDQLGGETERITGGVILDEIVSTEGNDAERRERESEQADVLRKRTPDVLLAPIIPRLAFKPAQSRST